MTPFFAFMMWLFACWVVTIYCDAPLQPAQIEDDLADVDTTDLHRLREMTEAERQQWLNLGSDVVSRAMRLRHVRQGVRRG